MPPVQNNIVMLLQESTFEDITRSPAVFKRICLIIGGAFLILAFEVGPPHLLIPLSFILAVILGFYTILTRRFAHRTCAGSHTPEERAYYERLKLCLLAAGLGLFTYIAFDGLKGITAWMLHSKGDTDSGSVDLLILWVILSRLGCLGCVIAIFMSPRVRLFFLGSSLLSGGLLMWVALILGGFAALLVGIVLLAFLPGIVVTLGLAVWLYTFYLLTRPCKSPKEYQYFLVLEGDRSRAEIVPEQTPYTLSPRTYASLCSDVSGLSAAPFSIQSADEGRRWTLHPASGSRCTVLCNGRAASAGCPLSSGSAISLQQVSAAPGSKTEGKSRQVIAIALFGDLGRKDIFPADTPHGVGSMEYRKICSDGGLVPSALYELTTDYKKSGSIWFITPLSCSTWEVLVDGALLTGKERLKIGSVITLRRRGFTEEMARVQVKGRFVYETSPGHTTPASSASAIIGQLKVTINKRKT